MEKVNTVPVVETKVTMVGSPLETEEQLLFTWRADSRVFKARGKEFYSSVIVLALLVSVIMFFIEGLMPVFLIWSVVFMIWVLSKTPPVKVTHKLTNWGIRTDDTLYHYNEMVSYWFEDRGEQMLLRVLLRNRVPGQLLFVMDAVDQPKVREILTSRARLEKPAPGWTDKLVKWLGDKIPLEEKRK